MSNEWEPSDPRQWHDVLADQDLLGKCGPGCTKAHCCVGCHWPGTGKHPSGDEP